MCTAWSASRTWRASRSQSEYTATTGRPISRQARMIRTAISPLLATRIFIRSERDISVLLRGVLVPLGLEGGEGGDQPGAGLARTDHFVHEPARGRDVGVGEFLLELGDPFRA